MSGSLSSVAGLKPQFPKACDSGGCLSYGLLCRDSALCFPSSGKKDQQIYRLFSEYFRKNPIKPNSMSNEEKRPMC